MLFSLSPSCSVHHQALYLLQSLPALPKLPSSCLGTVQSPVNWFSLQLFSALLLDALPKMEAWLCTALTFTSFSSINFPLLSPDVSLGTLQVPGHILPPHTSLCSLTLNSASFATTSRDLVTGLWLAFNEHWLNK